MQSKIPAREQKSLKMKFDKLVNKSKKSTGTTGMHISVRSAKIIGGEIMGKVQPVVFRGGSEEEHDSTSTMDLMKTISRRLDGETTDENLVQQVYDVSLLGKNLILPFLIV